jgi:hypothetical protein
MEKRLHVFSVALAAATCAVPLVSIAHADSAEQLRTQQAHQQELRTQTQQIAQQIELIIREFDRNGMGQGQDVKTLRSMSSMLSQLSDEQMQKVIVLLQQARGASDGGLNDEKQAYLTQQGIIGQFRGLLDEFQKEQSLYELADRFDRLAKRQASNLRSLVELAQVSVGKRLDQLDAPAAAALDAQHAEQASIAAEVIDALQSARSLMIDASGAEAEQLNKALASAQTDHLSTTVAAAASDLQAGDLFRAAGGEKDARDTLREAADLLAPPKTALEIKQDQLAKIDAELQQQKAIADQTRSPAPSESARAELHQVDRVQAANVDDTDQSRQKLQNISPVVAQALKQAESRMQQTRGDLAQHRRDRGAQDATAAADQLNSARNALEQEIGQAEARAQRQAQPAALANAGKSPATAPAAGDKLAQTRQLLDQVKQLRDQQQSLASGQPQNPPSARAASTPDEAQRALAAKARDLQQQAAISEPAAATQLGEAGKQMESASASMARGDHPSATDQQQAADASLAKAQDTLQQQANALAKAQDQLDHLQQTQQQIADLIQKQAEVSVATAEQAQSPTTQPAPANNSAGQPDSPAAQANHATTQPTQPPSAMATAQPANQAGQQQQVAQQTAAAQAQAAPDAPQAGDALSNAHQQMQQAAGQLQQNDTPKAQASQGAAMNDLGKAAVSVAGAMDQLKTQLGEPAGDPAAQKAAQEALNQANQALQNAQGQLDQAQAAGGESSQAAGGDKASQQLAAAKAAQKAAAQAAEKNLASAAQSAATAMGKNGSPEASNAMQQAIAELNQAGAQAQQGQPGPASQSAAAAQAALAQAQAALRAAQSAQAAASGDGPPGSASPSAPPAAASGSEQASAAQEPGKAAKPSSAMNGSMGDSPGGRAAQDTGARGATAGETAFVQLPPRDRQALQQSQAEKYPEEYGTLVEQYLRNLSDSQSK